MPTKSFLGNQLLSAIKWQQFPPKMFNTQKYGCCWIWGGGVFKLRKEFELEEILDHSSPNFIDEKTEAQRGNMTHSICTQYV